MNPSTNNVVTVANGGVSGSSNVLAETATVRNSSISMNSSSTSTTTTTRYETFTEAVPLSLSSMAHYNIPLTDGVVDGIIQVIHHTIHQCVNYAKICYALPSNNNNNNNNNNSSNNTTINYTDITTTPHAWVPIRIPAQEDGDVKANKNHPSHSIPHSLQKLQFKHCYTRNAFIGIESLLPKDCTKEEEMEFWLHHSDEWYNYSINKRSNPPTGQNVSTTTSTESSTTSTSSSSMPRTNNSNNGILGRISLLYCSTEPLTPEELNGTEPKRRANYTDDEDYNEEEDTDDNDVPPCICYQMIVEYRTLASTGNTNAKYAEELSMLSFGGSIDDEIKYGALSSLYDDLAKYVLEIYSVRGKKYKFDLMDSTLSNGTVPTFVVPSANLTSGSSSSNNNPRTNNYSNKIDPFLKNLCVTVTDHQSTPITTTVATPQSSSIETIDEEMKDVPNNDNNDGNNVATATGTKNNHFQIKGDAVTRMYLTMEGKLRSKNNQMDPLQDVPAFDYMKNVICYAFLRLNPSISDMVQAYPSGHSLLFDPDVAGHIYVNGRYAMSWGDDNGISASHGTALFGYDLLNIPFWNGRIVDYEVLKEAIAQLWYEILIDAKVKHLNVANKLLHRLMKGIDPSTELEEEDFNDNDLYDDTIPDDTTNIDVHQDCLESLVLAAPNYDRVGIAAKALATRFAVEFGKDAYPCLSHETEWVKRALPDRDPIVVPQRFINVVRRGGYFDVQKTMDLLWFNSDCRPVQEEYEIEIVNIAVQYLEEAGCTDVDSENIMITPTSVADNVVAKDAVCRYDPTTEQFYVQEDFLKSSINDLIGGSTAIETTPQQVKGYLLGMYIAKAHPVGYGKILARYLIRNKL